MKHKEKIAGRKGKEKGADGGGGRENLKSPKG